MKLGKSIFHLPTGIRLIVLAKFRDHYRVRRLKRLRNNKPLEVGPRGLVMIKECSRGYYHAND